MSRPRAAPPPFFRTPARARFSRKMADSHRQGASLTYRVKSELVKPRVSRLGGSSEFFLLLHPMPPEPTCRTQYACAVRAPRRCRALSSGRRKIGANVRFTFSAMIQDQRPPQLDSDSRCPLPATSSPPHSPLFCTVSILARGNGNTRYQYLGTRAHAQKGGNSAREGRRH